MNISDKDFFYCIKDGFSMNTPSKKGHTYYVNGIYTYKDGRGTSDFYLKSLSCGRDGKPVRFNVLCENGEPVERFHEYFITEEQHNRDEKIKELLSED